MKTWVISHDGKSAWNWHNPSERIDLTDADKFISEAIAKGDKIGSDDRHKTPGNVWD